MIIETSNTRTRRSLFIDPAPGSEGSPGAGSTGDAGKPAGAPQFVPLEEFNKAMSTIATLNASLQRMEGRLDEASATRDRAISSDKPLASQPTVTLAEIETALAEGKGADKLAKYVQESVDAALASFKITNVDPIQNIGFSTMESLTKEIVKPKMPHYNKYPKEVDDAIAKLPTHLRLHPEAQLFAYKAVIGSHVDEIVTEAKEAALRASSSDDGGTQPGAGSGRANAGAGSAKTPDAAALFGPEAADALRAKGVSQEDHAKRLGFKSWDDFATFTLKQREETNA